MRVLLVSAGAGLSRQVSSALAGVPDAELTDVPTPHRALDLLDAAASFDVVVADNDTHPTGGFSLAREVTGRRAMGSAMPPVVLLVARHQDAWLARWSGASACVVKPVDPFDLADVLHALAQGREVPALPGVRAGTHTAGSPAVAVLEAS